MIKEKTMPKAVGYRRISKEHDDNGLGLTAQSHAIESEAKRLGLVMAATFTDNGVSGGAAIEKRVELLAAIQALRAGDVLIVARRDRLARDVMLAGFCEKEVAKRGASIVSAAGEGNADDPASKLMRQIVDCFAEYERSLIRARTKAALAAKRARGERVTRHPPYGFRHVDGRLVKDRREQHGLKLMRELRDAGRSLRDVATVMHRKGYSNRNGDPLAAKVIRDALAR